MTTPEAALRSILLADAGVAALVGTRVYRNKLPEKVSYPAIRYQLISKPWAEHRTLEGPADYVKPRFQIDCWATEPDGELTLAQAVFRALEGYHGMIGSLRIDPIEVEDEAGDTETGVGPGGADVYRQRLDVFMPFTAAAAA